MTRKEALAELITKVEAGEPSPHSTWQRSLELHYSLGYRAAGGSLDAAKALHEAVLHERISKDELWSKRYGGTVVLRDHEAIIGTGSDGNNNPARAWLLAILRALHYQEQATNKTGAEAPNRGETGADFSGE